MSLPPPHPLLDATLRAVARRYRVPALSEFPCDDAVPATALAVRIEQARASLAAGGAPAPSVRLAFLGALARLIRDAMRPDEGDPVFQAMSMRHRNAVVREYASLSAGAAQDRREVLAAANAIAHPAKVERMAPGAARDALALLSTAAVQARWAALAEAAGTLQESPALVEDAAAAAALERLTASPALARLLRLDQLGRDADVRLYRTLWEQQGPRSGSATAAAQGYASRARGDAVEALALQALEALVRGLNAAEAGAPYRAVSSMRVPASFPASPARAKSEWDAALLRRSADAGAAPAWDLCLLLEAKASADAAATDFPRLLRGLRLLAGADARADYVFSTRQGAFPLRGAALRALPAEGPALAQAVLYFCDGPAETLPRLLSAASRMQLLSAPASLEYANRLAQGQDPAPDALEPVWRQLLESPQWAGVLQQYPMLCEARELMVHADDLMAAIADAASTHPAGSACPP